MGGQDDGRATREPQLVTAPDDAHGTTVQPASASESAGGSAEAWLAQARPRSLRVARHLIGNLDDAEEIAQEALALAWQRAGQIQQPQARDAWLYRVVVNLSMNRLRRKRPTTGIKFEPAASGRTPAAERDELVERLAIVLQDLPERQRTALVLREIEQLEYDNVAAILELSPAAVRVLVHRARERARAMLLERWPDTFGPT